MRSAETTLREELKLIIQEAVAAEAYEDVALIARMAGAAADAIRDLTPNDHTEPKPSRPSPVEPPMSPTVANTPNGNGHQTIKPRLLTRDQLPQFYRDGERLVKVAWSKKDKAPYTHFAPQPVITALIEAIQAKKGEGKLFRAGEVLASVRNSRQERYPSYQVYLALNWLREVDVISKRGRDGYVLKGKAATDERIAKHWNDLHIVNLHD
jgi:hypothetical protein